MRRVVITGLGVICPLGNTKEALWDALLAGRSGVTALDKLLPGALNSASRGRRPRFHRQHRRFRLAGRRSEEVDPQGPEAHVPRVADGRRRGAAGALADARLAPGVYDPERIGRRRSAPTTCSAMPEEFNAAYAAACDGGRPFEFSRWASEGMPQDVAPLWLLKYLPNMPASHVAIYNDLRGPNNSLTLREAAANLAVGEAYRMIVRGHAEVMLVGATGTRIHPMKTLHAAAAGRGGQRRRRAAPGLAGPSILNRRGMVLGEGAGAVVLEELEFAQARGATIYAEVVGAASSSVADANLVARRDTALANALRGGAARRRACAPRKSATSTRHGLSTRSCDVDEARAINQVFAARRAGAGHGRQELLRQSGAGSGMIELIGQHAGPGQHDRLFPVLNYETPDPECPLAVVRSTDARPGESFLNNSVTPQGQASCVLVRRLA